MHSVLSSFLLIALAEMGDKTQLVALSFAARFRPWQVIGGVFLATIVVHLFSVVIGFNIGAFVPMGYVRVLVGLSFLGFGVWTLRGDRDPGAGPATTGRGPLMTVAAAFFLAELGDKTQLATISLAAQYRSIWGVWIGSTLGMTAADALAVGLGMAAGKRLPARAVQVVSAGIFILFGCVLTAGALRGIIGHTTR